MTADAPPAKLPPGKYWELGGEEPDRKTASFRLRGDRLDPSAVTRAIGLTPTEAHRKGDSRPHKPGRRKRPPWPTGLWNLESAQYADPSEDRLDGHITQLLDQLEDKADVIHQLCAEQGLIADFFCGYFMCQSNSGFELSVATLERMAALNASFGLDLYGPDPDAADRVVIVE
jgi:Domain of unknown function (DUF4279)